MPFKNKYDVIVAGAGIAGICAAIKSQKLGAETLLIERYSFLGGMSSAGMVTPLMKYWFKDKILVKGVFEDLQNEMRKFDGMIDNGFYALEFRKAAYKLLKNANVDILFNSEIIKTNFNNRKLESVTINSHNQKKIIQGNVFIDTSGDASLIYLSGLPFQKGDEMTGNLQTMTLFFRMGGIDIDRVKENAWKNKEDYFAWIFDTADYQKIISIAGFFNAVKKELEKGELQKELSYIFFTTLPEKGEGAFNTTNIMGLDASSSSDLTKAEIIGREQVNQVINFLVNKIEGFENSYLLESAVQIGVRETRRVIGDYTINGEDVKTGRKFNDAIARACYGIDIHGQENEDSRMEELPENQYYEIPMKALFVKDADNILSAGRCVSSTREGHSAVRIQPTCAAMGEAAGAIAALAIKNNLTIRNVDYKEVRKELLENLE
ncbi:MAG: FAD-dependent oxidoreductase [Ignavibacteriales bacterium]|nr:FAD-dependent oxidoreductase [Ignavibacteriales bacterium]